MQVSLRIVGGLHKYIPGASERMEIQVDPGDTVRQALDHAGIRPELLSTILLDGERTSLDQVLEDGQQMTVIALMGGGSQSVGCS
jgi:hypothetical protein